MSNTSRILAAVLCALTPAALCVSQSPTSFSVVPTKNSTGMNSGWTPQNIYAVDVNNDGIPDLIQDESVSFVTGASTGAFGVSISNGDGTFKPAISVVYPPGTFPTFPMTFGDFNGDGKIDIAMPLVGKKTIAIYLGKGDGTFVSPWYFKIPIASDSNFSASPLVAADFNHDGKLDLAVIADNSKSTSAYQTTTIYVLPGAGNGTFSTATPVLASPTAGNASGSAVASMVTGDFDGDTNADIGLTITTANGSGGYSCVLARHVVRHRCELQCDSALVRVAAQDGTVGGRQEAGGAASHMGRQFVDQFQLVTGPGQTHRRHLCGKRG